MRPKEEAQRYNFQRAPFCQSIQSKHDQGRRRKRRQKKSGATEINGLRKIRRSRTPTLEKASACFDVIKVDRSIGDCCMIPLVASATQNAASRFIQKMDSKRIATFTVTPSLLFALIVLTSLVPAVFGMETCTVGQQRSILPTVLNCVPRETTVPLELFNETFVHIIPGHVRVNRCGGSCDGR